MRMVRAVLAAAVSAGLLAGCGGEGLTFGGLLSGEEGPPGGVGPGPVVEQVLTLSASPTPGGVIVSTVGLPPTQGFWDAELVRVPSSDASVYAMEFRLRPPPRPWPRGTQPSREVLGGTFLTRGELEGISRIAVLGRGNSRVVTRR
jgi:hypothetical protein